MSRLVMVYIGKVNGIAAYSPMDKDDELIVNGKDVIVCETIGSKAARTALQNRSLHKYFELLCDALNSAGWDMKATLEKLSKKATIPWSPLAIKERLWKPVQIDTYDKDSTTKLNTDEVSAVYEALNSVTSEQLGVSVPFPDRYSQMYAQLYGK